MLADLDLFFFFAFYFGQFSVSSKPKSDSVGVISRGIRFPFGVWSELSHSSSASALSI